MDERMFLYGKGQPIPAWDMLHRLSTCKPVGPECKDTATVFRINSTYMDITDQPFMNRHTSAGAALTACFFIFLLSYFGQFIVFHPPAKVGITIVLIYVLVFFGLGGFGYAAYRAGRGEFFALKRRPIRFNRKEQKIYTIRHRRFFAKPGQGDVTWEVPWNADSIFCIHRGVGALDEPYHIRHYTVDADGNVLRAFAIGREWNGKENLEGLLSQ